MDKCKNILIVGAGGFGREVAWLIEKINERKPTWNILGFIDDCEENLGKAVGNYKVVGNCNDILQYPDAYVVCTIGAAMTRKKVIEKIKQINPDIQFATLIDPDIRLCDRVQIGEGTVICTGTIITTDIKIGNHVIVNLACTVGHDAVIDDFVTLYPTVNVSGNTILNSCVEMGTGSQIIQGKNVGEYTIVGAGAVVIKDLPEKCVAVGMPAIPKKFFEVK